MENQTLHGTIAGAPNPSSPIRWLPYGGVGPVPIKPGADVDLSMIDSLTDDEDDPEQDR